MESLPEGTFFRTGAYITGLRTLGELIGGGVCIEVGSAMGESALILAEYFDKVICIDPWPEIKNEQIFNKRMAANPKLSKIKGQSVIVATQFDDNSVQAVYIDAQHDRPSVRADILAWFHKATAWIAGHDYDDLPDHEGVVQAVDQLLGLPQYRFEDSSWAFRKTPDLLERVLETAKEW